MLRGLGLTLKSLGVVLFLYVLVYIMGIGATSIGDICGGQSRDRVGAIICKTGRGLIPDSAVADGKFYPDGVFSRRGDTVRLVNATSYAWIMPRIESGKHTVLAEVLLLPAGARMSISGCKEGFDFWAYAVTRSGRLVSCNKRLNVGTD